MLTVDTFNAYDSLTGAEMPEKQARAVVAIVQDLQTSMVAGLATKGDIALLRSDITVLNGEVTILREDVAVLKGDMASLRKEMRQLETGVENRLRNFETGMENKFQDMENQLQNLESGIDGKLGQLENRLVTQITMVKIEMIKWLVPVILAQGAFVVALIKF